MLSEQESKQLLQEQIEQKEQEIEKGNKALEELLGEH